MLVIRDDTPDRLFIGVSAWEERLGLLYICLTIFILGLIPIALLQSEFIQIPRTIGWFDVFSLVLNSLGYLVPLGLGGAIMVFSHRRFILFRKERKVVYKRGLGRPLVWNFDDIQALEVEMGAPGHARFQIKVKGETQQIVYGKIDKVRPIAFRVGTFLEKEVMETQAPVYVKKKKR